MKPKSKSVRAPSRSKRPTLNQSGQGLTEYIVLLLLVAMCSVAATTTLGSRIKQKIRLATDHINSDITITE